MASNNRNHKEKFTFVKDDKFAWAPAILVKQEGNVAHVKIPKYPDEQSIVCDGGEKALGWKECTIQLDDYQNQQLPIQNVNQSGEIQSFSDMVDFEYLHEVRPNT